MSCSIVDLESRLASLPQLLAAEYAAPAPDLGELSAKVQHWDVVGVGASEAPARLLVGALNELRISARFCTISHFVEPAPPRRELASHGLVIFSQGLSPNARLALQHSYRYALALLFTSVEAMEDSERGEALRAFPGTVWRHAPRREPGSLLRLAGPPVAALAAMRAVVQLAKAAGREIYWEKFLSRSPGCYDAPLAERPATAARLIEGERPAGCLAVGMDTEIAGPLMWKWQEGLYQPVAPSFDVLAFAHGGLQSIYEHDRLLVALVRSELSLSVEGKARAASHAQLWERLAEVARVSKLTLLTLEAALPGPLAYFEWDAAWSRLLLDGIAAQSINPGTWPGKNADGALYALGEQPLEPASS